MKANEFLHTKDVAYMNRLSTSLDFDKIVSLMEEYAALRIHDVVGRSEQLVCPNCKQPFTKEELEVKEHCFNCGWEFAN